MQGNRTLNYGTNSYALFNRVIDVSIIFLSLFLVFKVYPVSGDGEYRFASLLVVLLYVLVSEAVSLYRRWRIRQIKQMLIFVVIPLITAFIGLVAVAFMLKISDDYSRIGIALWFLFCGSGLLAYRIIFYLFKKAAIKRGYFTRNVAIVGATESGERLYQEILKHPEMGMRCIGFFDDRNKERVEKELHSKLIDNINSCVEYAKSGEVEVLFLALPLIAQERIKSIVNQLGDTTVDVHLIPDFLLSNLMHSRIDHVGEVDTLSVFESPYYGVKRIIKRLEDLVIGSAILLLISPLLISIGVMVRLTSKGPALFKQDRYGLGGEKIKVWKFRSMVVMENSDEVVQATKGDARVTKLGAFLRKTSLDELPQFFNVISGTMSIVGPRPHAVSHNEEYRKKVEFYMLRHKVKPGITGWAQINGWRGETDTLEKMEKRVEFDLQYIKHWSVFLDFKIIILTIFKGFMNKNAY